VFLLYERGDVRGANDLLADVLRRHPDYRPALARMAELRAFCTGQLADGIEYGEHALALDPMGEEVRRVLLRSYLAVGDLAAAEEVDESAAHESTVRRIPLAMYKRDWLEAGEAAYEAIARQTLSPIDSVIAVQSVRQHARASRDFERARNALESISDVRWEDGRPVLSDRPSLREGDIGLADVLLQMGRAEEGRQLLQAIVERMRRELAQGRPEIWYRGTYPIALALLGERDEALALLQRSFDSREVFGSIWSSIGIDPAYDALRDDPRYQAMVAAVQRNAEEQRRELERRRADGRVPMRGAGTASGSRRE
jgi:tetratricopeptide (TPR) repeat protein